MPEHETGRIAFEPVDRAEDALDGRPGEVRFLSIPARRCVMIDGAGPAGDEAFAPRLPGLYATAWTLRFALKRRGIVTKVGPLEGLWWTSAGATSLDVILAGDRDDWRWTLLIGLPDAGLETDIDAALEAGRAKLALAHVAHLRVETLVEGDVAQVLHKGPYEAERSTIEHLHLAIAGAALTPHGRHHEIYLSDPRLGNPANMRTILRQPVRPA